jgi:hypothetical protein
LVIHKDKESFLVVLLLALKMKKDLSEMAGWVGPTKKGMGVFGHGKLRILFDLVPGTLNTNPIPYLTLITIEL